MSGRKTNGPRAFALLGVVVLSVAGAGCMGGEEPAGPDDPSLTRIRFDPGLAYRAWWEQISACSGFDGDFDRVRFFEVVSPLFIEGQQFPCGAGVLCNGMWESPHDITLAPAFRNSERLVKHEMLHDLLGTTDHPPIFEACDVEWAGSDPRSRGGTFP